MACLVPSYFTAGHTASPIDADNRFLVLFDRGMEVETGEDAKSIFIVDGDKPRINDVFEQGQPA